MVKRFFDNVERRMGEIRITATDRNFRVVSGIEFLIVDGSDSAIGELQCAVVSRNIQMFSRQFLARWEW